MKVALLQLCSGDDPAQNLSVTCEMARRAAQGGATFVLTPEVTNCVSLDRARQRAVLQTEAADLTLRGLRACAADLSVWLSVGSLALQGETDDGRFVNRSFLIDPKGDVRARYDKIHMFDVRVSDSETYHESSGYRPGDSAVVSLTDIGKIGLSICYDLRFPQLYRALGHAGADILLVPSAFSPVTGQAHWETLLRARAIETGCFVLAAAQTGMHAAHSGARRQTYGHSLVVNPWGEVLADGGTDVGIVFADIDVSEVAKARARIPTLAHDRPFAGPDV